MPLDQTANFARGEIDAAVAAADTTITVVDGTQFPDPANGNYNLVIFDQTQHARPDQDPNVEIVRATSRVSTTELAVTRGREGTNAADHPVGSAVLLSATSKVFDDVAANDQAVENFTSNSTTAGEVLTSNGSGGVEFAAASAASITRNGNEIEYVALDTANLPAATGSGDVALVTGTNVYVEDIGGTGTLFDITSADFSLDTSISTQNASPTGIEWNDDGSRLYEVGNNPNLIYQSTLSTPFDITTASFDTSINSQDAGPRGIAWNNDGSKLYEVGDQIYQSSLSTPFDITTASFDTSIGTQDGLAKDIAWNNDGSRLYETGSLRDRIYQSTLSTPFDITTASFDTSIPTQDPNTNTDIAWNNDGTRLYEAGNATEKIFQSTLSTPFDIATASLDTSVSSQDASPTGIAWNNTGSRLYEIGSSSNLIYQINVSVPDRWEPI